MSVAELWSTTETAKRLGVAKQTMALWRLRGFGPRFVKIGSRVFYDARDVDRWLESRKRSSTSDDGHRSRDAA